MKKQIFGRQLKRDIDERKALFKGLMSSLIMYERIETTAEKAKSIRGQVEKLVTKAKNNESTHARRLLEAYLTHDALQKMLTDVAPRFANRPGGYTRIIKIGNRFSDNASMVIMEWVEKGSTGDRIVKDAKNTSKKEVLRNDTKVIRAVRPKKTVKATPKKEVKLESKKDSKKKEIK